MMLGIVAQQGTRCRRLVPDRVQAHGRRLLGAFEDQGTPIGLQDNQEVGEVHLRVPARWGSCPHVQGRAGLDGDQHEILAEDNVATTEPRPEPARLQLLMAWRAKLAAFATAMLRHLKTLGREEVEGDEEVLHHNRVPGLPSPRGGRH
ncbi:Putative transposable element [Caligus rogercresseyi]|uniref:Transposable element n=1 Tax=Caligus rogercresseyi TaxID=217165 RepID=A0A7T8KI19_CALRO|nr:Putative transposable element [Caligus rogercresseyi]